MRTLFVAVSASIGLNLAAAEKPIPVADEPMHRTVFENEIVRVIDVQIPPGAASLYHTHVIPSVIVYLTQSTNRSESWPDGAILTREISPGQSRYAAYDENPLSHRVTNTGRSWFRVFDIELLKKPAAYAVLSPVQRLTPQWTERLVRSSNLTLTAGAKIQLPATSCAWLIVTIEGSMQLAPIGTSPPATRAISQFGFLYVPPQTRFEITADANDGVEAVVLEIR
ncbi:MAG: hypothetical protein ABIR80_21865 [Opitutaceae bacterium]